jgi:ATP-binding cassette subfamily B protein
MALVIWRGGTFVLSSRLSVGELVSFLFYVGLLYEPIAQLQGLNQILQAARAAGERILDIIDAAPENGGPHNKRFSIVPVKGEVSFSDVCFSYDSDRTALRNISLHAKPGEMIALVGPTGSGKSSLVNLLPRFYDADSGSITIDGVDIRGLNLSALRSQIAVVTQETFLFYGTVRENLLYGKLDATEHEMVQAAIAANCHVFIERLPEGYDTLLGERAVQLSVGEKQRLSIARALLKNAPILILDEATSSVDNATERAIQGAFLRLMKNRTSFVIAHRLSTIQRADNILVLRDGEIVERGTHRALLARGGLYSALIHVSPADGPAIDTVEGKGCSAAGNA